MRIDLKKLVLTSVKLSKILPTVIKQTKNLFIRDATSIKGEYIKSKK